MNALLTDHAFAPDDKVDPEIEAPRDAGAELAAQARAIDQSVRAFVVERPLIALGAALAGGFLLGRLLAR